MGAPAIALTGAGAVPWPSPDRIPHETAELPAEIAERVARVERISALVLLTGAAALRDAGIALVDGRRVRGGVVLGTAFGCLLTNAAYQRRLVDGGVAAASPRLFAATVSNAAAGEMAIAFGLAGPAITLTAGGASGLVALGHATSMLRAGRADMLLAGGADAVDDPLVRWIEAGGLAVGRPVVEASAMLVVEPASVARARGAAVQAMILGHAAGFVPPNDPDGAAQALVHVIRRALRDAGVDGERVSLVVRGAPPALADLEERALRAALGDRASVAGVAPKEMLGETLGAAGPLGVLALVGAAPRGTIALVLDVCASGQVAAVVAAVGDLA